MEVGHSVAATHLGERATDDTADGDLTAAEDLCDLVVGKVVEEAEDDGCSLPLGELGEQLQIASRRTTVSAGSGPCARSGRSAMAISRLRGMRLVLTILFTMTRRT